MYESKKSQKAMTDFIPRELDDGDDLDFTPSVSDNLTTRDLNRKTEKYSDRHGGHDISPMNNELQRQDHRATNHQSLPGQAVLRNNDLANHQPMRGQAVLRNNDLANHQPMRGQAVLRNKELPKRQPNKDALRDKNRTADQLGKRQSEKRHVAHSTYSKPPATKALEDGLSQKKLNAESRGKPAAETGKKPASIRTRDSATASVSVTAGFQ